MKLTIKNSEWLRGTGKRDGWYGVLFHNGCYCAQGIYCKLQGVTDAAMTDEIRVACIVKGDERNSPDGIKWLISRNGKTLSGKSRFVASLSAIQIEAINDNTKTTDTEKIELLKPIFADHGVEIEYREDL